MKKKIILAIIALIPVLSARSENIDAQELLRFTEKTLMPIEYYSEMDMKTYKPGKPVKVISMNSWYKKDLGSFIEITAPSRSKGTRMLQKNNSLWLYNPKSGSSRALRLSPKDNFQGSVFSNNDVGDSQYSDDYEALIAGKEIFSHDELGQVECFILHAAAKNNESPYGRIEMIITVDDFIPLWMIYFAKSGLLFKKMTFSGIREMAGVKRPLIYRMDSVEEQNTYSIIEITVLEERNDLPDSMFTLSRLTR